MEEAWHVVAQTPLAAWVRGSNWAYPLLEIAHVIGLGLLFGAIVAMDLRLLGVSRALPVRALGRHLLPAAWTGFAINAVSGMLLFVSAAAEFAGNMAFRVKLVLIVLAGLNALLFHARIYRRAGEWDRESRGTPPGVKAVAILSLILWLAVIAAGRMDRLCRMRRASEFLQTALMFQFVNPFAGRGPGGVRHLLPRRHPRVP